MRANCLIFAKFLLLTIVFSKEVVSSRILFLLPMASKSEAILFATIAKELSLKGHDITYVSPFPVDSKPKNFDAIIPLGETEPFDAGNTIKTRMEKKTGKMAELLSFDLSFIFANCHKVYNSTEFQKIYKKEYDLMILSAIFNECFYGLVHKFKAPFILMSSMPVSLNTVTPTGLHQPSSFVPLPYLEFPQNMNFWERFQNTLIGSFFSLMGHLGQDTYTELYRQYLGQDYPALGSIEKNVSLILSNSHFSMNFPRPFLPDIVEIGGLHCKDAKPLPKELNDFVSGSKDGFIYFSLGSLVKGASIPESMRKVFVKVFSKLKQRVLWKWETEEMEGLPQNVKLGKWLPQQDILGHPNIKLFITHGGLLSTQEAVYHGVPLLGFPIFVDQDANMKLSSEQGFATTLEFSEVTEEKLESVIREMLSNPRYTNRAKELSTIYRDRPQPPLKLALYWIEYILNHKGAEHLRSSARDLNFAQYHSLDVIAVLLFILVTLIYIGKLCCRYLVRKLRSGGQNGPGPVKHKNKKED